MTKKEYFTKKKKKEKILKLKFVLTEIKTNH